MIPPRLGLAAVAVLAALLARKRPVLRPVAVTLGALAVIDIARGIGLPPRPDAALWIAWACVQGAYTWRAWKDEGPGSLPAAEPSNDALNLSGQSSPRRARRRYEAGRRASTSTAPLAPRVVSYPRTSNAKPITLTLACLALPALPFLPVRWTPLAWQTLLVAPHWAAVAVGLVAWAGARPRTVAQAVALVLTWSAALDVAIGALAPGAGWVRAAPLAWAAWGVVGVVLMGAERRHM